MTDDLRCQATTWQANDHPKMCGKPAVIEARLPAPAFMCLACAVSIHKRVGLTWRRIPRERPWREDSPYEHSPMDDGILKEG